MSGNTSPPRTPRNPRGELQCPGAPYRSPSKRRRDDGDGSVRPPTSPCRPMPQLGAVDRADRSALSAQERAHELKQDPPAAVALQANHEPGTLHLTADELPPAWRFPDGVLPADLVRAHRYSHIARTVPPRFVSKAGYRLEHSLAPAAFECIHAKFTQLLVLQNLARLDGQLLTEQLGVHMEIAQCSPQPQSQLDTMTTAEQAATVTYAVLAVIGRHCVDMSTVTGEPHAVECCPTEDADRDAAYDWLV
jgi:hypothetical protein